jgi:hypothetical protein
VPLLFSSRLSLERLRHLSIFCRAALILSGCVAHQPHEKKGGRSRPKSKEVSSAADNRRHLKNQAPSVPTKRAAGAAIRHRCRIFAARYRTTQPAKGWQNYLTTGHGGNRVLIRDRRDARNAMVSILEVSGSAQTERDIINQEMLWQRKSGTKAKRLESESQSSATIK